MANAPERPDAQPIAARPRRVLAVVVVLAGLQILCWSACGGQLTAVDDGGGAEAGGSASSSGAPVGSNSGSGSGSGSGSSSGADGAFDAPASSSGDDGSFDSPDSSSGDDSALDAEAFAPPSCQAGGDGLTNCGAAGESCCTSPLVVGGTYSRTYYYDVRWGNPVSEVGPYGEVDPATVSSFRLDKYLVTVGRFRQFVKAWNNGAGYRPPPGSGKHTHLNGGQGLVSVGGDSGVVYEPGWVASDDANIAPTDANLACAGSYSTWTPTPTGHETLPMTCMNRWEAYAFCIWDGGFVPSEAEWEYAAGGGDQQRVFPWGPAFPTDKQYAIYECDYPGLPDDGMVPKCSGVQNIAPVGAATLGVGRWGQLDLAGEVSEVAMDHYAPYVTPCIDCVNLQPSAAETVTRAGYFASSPWTGIYPTLRGQWEPQLPQRNGTVGFRCARSP